MKCRADWQAHAAAYVRNDVDKFLPYIRRLLVNQDPSFEYTVTSPFGDDDEDQHPGDMIVPQLILPLMASLLHANEEIGRLYDILSVKDRELKEAADILALNGLPPQRSRGPDFDRDAFEAGEQEVPVCSAWH
ncbi:hypothetical protein HK405_004746 [Cladochytrium tenue]|nr:hypothetical protein HK405_004746 [Cladochytrium tenue]